MLFTAGPLARNQVSSDRFKSHGAVNVAPCQISEVRIGPVPLHKSPAPLLNLIINFYAIVAAIALGKAVSPETFSNIFVLTLPTNFIKIFLIPMMAISINKPSQSSLERLTALNFQKQSQGRYIFFTGPSTDEAMRDVVQIPGVLADAYCPRGYASVHGIITLNIINRALYYAFTATSSLTSLTLESIPSLTSGFAITEKNYSSVTKGTFFPYFDGLLLADHGSTISTFVSLFSRCLGRTPAEILENSETLYSGWASVANTTAGRAASHAIWCLEKGLQAAVNVRPVILNGEYSGCVLLGAVAFIANGKKVLPTLSVDLVAEIEALLTHDVALSGLVELINSITEKEYAREHFKSYRSIHNVLRALDISNENRNKLREFIRKLKFTETTWSSSDSRKVTSLVQAIARKDFLPDDAPLFAPTEHIFTKDVILSNLCAFGAKAPSLVSKGTGVARPFGQEVYKGLTSPGNLTGIPVFVLPLQEAFELWKTFMNDHVIKFSHAGKDKMGRLRVKAVDSYIPLDSPECGEIMGVLSGRFRGEKRKLSEIEEKKKQEIPDQDDEDRRRKRRMKGYGVLFGGAAPEGGDLPEEEMAEDDPLRMFE